MAANAHQHPSQPPSHPISSTMSKSILYGLVAANAEIAESPPCTAVPASVYYLKVLLFSLSCLI